MKNLFLFLVSIFFLSILLFACGSDNSESGQTTREYFGTQNPGDVWTWEITTDDDGTGTFKAKNETTGYSYSGTVETLPNKFLKCMITWTDDPDFIPYLPVMAYALEYPNASLIVQTEVYADMIVCVAKGSCLTESVTYNWVNLLEKDWDEGEEVYGIAEFTITGGDMTLDVTSYFLNGTEGSGWTIDTGLTCTDGRITAAGHDFVINLTPSGLYICDGGPGQGGNAGMIAPDVNIDLADLLKNGREFRGIKCEDGNDGPVWVEANGANLTGGGYSDFEAGTEDRTHTATITFGAQSFPGIINSVMTYNDDPSQDDIVFIVNKIAIDELRTEFRYYCYGSIAVETGGGGNFFLIEVEE